MPGHPILIRSSRPRRPWSSLVVSVVVLRSPYDVVAVLPVDRPRDRLVEDPVEAVPVPPSAADDPVLVDAEADAPAEELDEDGPEDDDDVRLDDVRDPVVPELDDRPDEVEAPDVAPADPDVVDEASDEEEPSDHTSCEGRPLIRFAT